MHTRSTAQRWRRKRNRISSAVSKECRLADRLEDILITLGKQYHIIRPIASKPGLFIYLVLDKVKSNLALARRSCQEQEQTLTL
ncbi:hypothetical protein ACFPN2_38420 [Steroidobacter flavus]|uniref:Uncharacterized protein n=1 Tax=Steroidobacter flavus TaxID=1842136 RepID=A0ABV8T6W1_9GAMM